MNDALPASASSSARFLMAAVALSPFLVQIAPSLRGRALLCGSFTALGYISQSIALVDTPAATVAFLGALTVIVCPALAVIVDGRKLGFAEAPQVWAAAVLALAGVAVLELGGGADGLAIGVGDLWSVLQAVGFGTSFYITERMMAKEPTQVLPITAAQCAMSALIAGVWAAADGLALGPFAQSESAGWLLDETARATNSLPGLLNAAVVGEGPMREVALAAVWTGLITTAANRVGETNALGKVASSEAAVLLATEPLWAAVFASVLIGEGMSSADAAGGALIIGACLANAADPAEIRQALGRLDYEADSEYDAKSVVPDAMDPVAFVEPAPEGRDGV